MSEKIIFAAGNNMGFFRNSSVAYLSSQYLKNYIKNRKEIRDKNVWKTEGVGAQFRGDSHSLKDYDENLTNAAINGVAFVNDGEQIVYSISVESFSGLFLKNPADNDETEGHIIHDTRVGFYNLDYNPATNELVISMHHSGVERNIAILNIKNGHYKFLTEGESIDENPVWGRTNPKVIYYDSSGIGRTSSGAVAGFSPKVICSLDLNTGELKEIISMDKIDCFLPKEDSQGNIFFIKKPFSQNDGPNNFLKDILFIPVKILKAIYNWLEFFTMRYTGETFKTSGRNPAKSKAEDPQQVFINGNLINIEKTLKENEMSGEKYPGIVPKSWELMKMSKKGEMVCIKRGVLDFALNSQDQVIFSNGKYLVKLWENDNEEILDKADLATKLKVI